MKKLISLALAILAILPMLAGCHGSRGLAPFDVPEVFDESKTYEITFWAKNDTETGYSKKFA